MTTAEAVAKDPVGNTGECTPQKHIQHAQFSKGAYRLEEEDKSIKDQDGLVATK